MAIKIIKNYCENGCDIAEDNWCPSCQREQFMKLLEALPSAQQWIPVSEKLPKVDEEVFISFGHGSPLEIGKYNGKQWEYLYESGADYWTEPFFEVKAWMPLPDRYKE